MAHQLLHADQFFSTSRERYRIKLRRESGEPWPWTDDPIFREWRFTNVHREDDRTTIWFRENIRDRLNARIGGPDLQEELENLEAIIRGTLIFRWFNRIETGEIIKDLLLDTWDTEEARRRLTGVSPVVTGAYIIKAGDGVSKLDGILDCIDGALPRLRGFTIKWENLRDASKLTLKQAWEDLKQLHYMGGFMSYEVVTDLRHTVILNEATDIMTWGNLGPGAIRGMGYLVADDPYTFNNSASSQREMLALMQQLLELSKQEEYWPQEWPIWEMHEIEMWLCEYCKYRNAQRGDRLKRRYKEK